MMRGGKLWITVTLLLVAAVAAWLAWPRPTVKKADVVVAIRTFALNLDPATLAETDSRKVATLLYTGLVAVDQDGTVRPRIARSWKRLDPNSWSFTLADRVTFPDGTPVTAAKVIQSLCASMQPAHVQAWSLASIDRESAGKGAVRCTGLSAPDDHTVLVREKRPTPWLMEALAGPGGWIVDTARKPGQYGVRAGAGPYVVASVVPDKQIVLKARAGSAVPARLQHLVVRYIPDDQVAAAAFSNGELGMIELDTPQLRDLVLTKAGKLRAAGTLHRNPMDRVRVVGFNFKRLAQRGIDAGHVRQFLDLYSGAIARAAISGRAQGLVKPMVTGFPPSADPVLSPPANVATPAATLTLLTENDPFSDMMGAMLPAQVGKTQIRYQAVEKSLLISALLEGDYDLALLKLEATHHTPRFWAAFFTPGDPYTVFGRAIPGLEALDLADQTQLQRAGQLVNSQGNWVGVFREVNTYATGSGIDGVRLTPSGQLSLEEIGRSG